MSVACRGAKCSPPVSRLSDVQSLANNFVEAAKELDAGFASAALESQDEEALLKEVGARFLS